MSVDSSSIIPPLISNSPPPPPSSSSSVLESNSTEETIKFNNWDPFSEKEETTGDWAQFNGANNEPQEEEEEDDWGGFVEPIINNQITQSAQSAQLQVQQVEENSNLINNLIEKLFTSEAARFEFSKREENLKENNELLNIDLDEMWQELKTFTSINDASLSLKFKWYLSNLEDNYLKSLSLQRASPNSNINNNNLFNQKKNNFPFVSNGGGILQPVKLEPSQITSSQNTNNSNSPSLIPIDNNNSKQTDDDVLSLTINESNTNTNNAAVLDLDLSYFESQQSTTTTNKSKGYLDLLLQDIYANTNNNSSIKTSLSSSSLSKSNKDDDLLADKKSITSIGSANSNDMPIQLQPQLLEQQIIYDIIQTNRTSDQQAIKILSKLQSLSLNNTKPLVFPLKNLFYKK